MLDTRRPFTRAEALAAGITPKQLRHSRFRQLLTGVYVDAQVPDHPLVRAMAALLVHPAAAMVSHTTAALLYDLPVRRDTVEHVCVPDASHRSSRAGVRSHVSPTQVSRLVHGVRVARPEDVFVQLASMLSLVDLVVVGDALLRQGLVGHRELVSHVDASRGRHRVLARRAAGYLRERVDSPMESRLRMLIVLAGLPEPEVNHEIRDAFGSVVKRIDLSYPKLKLAIEYDGRHNVEREQQWERDLQRREELEHGDWRVIVVTSKGIFGDPGGTVGRIFEALRARGCPGLPARLKDGWRPFFP